MVRTRLAIPLSIPFIPNHSNPSFRSVLSILYTQNHSFRRNRALQFVPGSLPFGS